MLYYQHLGLYVSIQGEMLSSKTWRCAYYVGIILGIIGK